MDQLDLILVPRRPCAHGSWRHDIRIS